MRFSSQENPSLFFFFFLCLSTVSAYTNSSNNGDEAVRRELRSGRCNWFRGNWVYDVKYPLYDPYKCPFIDPQFNCKKYGRPDNLYLKYRWQPSSCSLPRYYTLLIFLHSLVLRFGFDSFLYVRFNGLYFLRKMRGKKIMLVGDSLSTNMWQSLACLIHSWVPKTRYTLLRQKGLVSLTFEVCLSFLLITHLGKHLFHLG